MSDSSSSSSGTEGVNPGSYDSSSSSSVEEETKKAAPVQTEKPKAAPVEKPKPAPVQTEKPKPAPVQIEKLKSEGSSSHRKSKSSMHKKTDSKESDHCLSPSKSKASSSTMKKSPSSKKGKDTDESSEKDDKVCASYPKGGHVLGGRRADHLKGQTSFKLKIPELKSGEEKQWWDAIGNLREVRWEQSCFTLVQKSIDVVDDEEFKIRCNSSSDVNKPRPDGRVCFGPSGVQVPVNKVVTVTVTVSLKEEAKKFSFKLLHPRDLRYTLSASHSEVCLSPKGFLAGKDKHTVDIDLKLKVSCTTRADIRIPVICWKGDVKDSKKIVFQGKPDEKHAYVCYLQTKIESQLSTRLDIEDMILYQPKIGSGGFGNVYRGNYRSIDVACKILNQEYAVGLEKQLIMEEFLKEVKNYECLRHPCIVTFIGAVFVPGSFALVTELCPYGSLQSALEKYGEDVWDIYLKIKALYDTARAMDFLHQSSVIHRDLKPENMLMVSLECSSVVVCKLSDFGTTKGTNSLSETFTMTKAAYTPVYMAPEIIEGSSKYTSKVDVYSFGIMMATVADKGEVPFPEAKTAFQLYDMVCKGKRPDIHCRSSLPPKYISLMEACWDAKPERRPSFSQILTCLEALFDSLS